MLSYKAHIQLFNLPFEAWSVSRVSAIVSGFGRFLRAEESSIHMHDLMGFKCAVAVNDLADIPEHLEITLGDVIVMVQVILERSAPFGGDDRGVPLAGGDPGEGGDQTDPLGRRIARRVPTLGAEVEECSNRAAIHSDPSWDSSEIRDCRRASSVVGRPARGPRDPDDAFLPRANDVRFPTTLCPLGTASDLASPAAAADLPCLGGNPLPVSRYFSNEAPVGGGPLLTKSLDGGMEVAEGGVDKS